MPAATEPEGKSGTWQGLARGPLLSAGANGGQAWGVEEAGRGPPVTHTAEASGNRVVNLSSGPRAECVCLRTFFLFIEKEKRQGLATRHEEKPRSQKD